jgi:hypothetical protein
MGFDRVHFPDDMRRSLGGITIDRTANVARVLVRAIPLPGGEADDAIEAAMKAKRAPDRNPVPVRNRKVPRTGLEPARTRVH